MLSPEQTEPQAPPVDQVVEGALPPAEPRRRGRRWLKVLAIIVGLLLLLIAVAPYVLSLDTFRRRIESEASKSLGVPVTVESHDFSWFRGVTVSGLRVANPPGFDSSHPLLAMGEARFDVSLLQLVRGRFDVTGTVEQLVVNIDQDGEGRTNLAQLGADRESSGPEAESEPGSSDLSHIRLDVRLNGARVDITRDGRLLESMRSVDCLMAKAYDDSEVRVDLSAALQGPEAGAQPGALDVRANLDLSQNLINATVSTTGLDLERYRPVVAAFLEPGAITDLAGVLNGKLDIEAEGADRIIASGEMIVEGPRLAGALLQGMKVDAPRWKFTPVLSITKTETGESVVQADGMSIDLGFCQLQGLDASALQAAMGSDERGLGVRYSVDLAAVTGFGGPIPELLRSTVGQVEGTIALPWAAVEGEHTDLMKAMRVDAQLAVPKFGVHAFEVSDLKTRVQLEDGKLSLSSLEGTKLNAGALSLSIGTDLNAAGTMPVSVSLNWNDGKVQGQAAEVLRYGIPLLAGLGDAASFQSGIGMNLDLKGPIAPEDGQTVLDWLQLWTGRGDVRLANGSFSPTEALQGLLAATGNKGRLDIDELATKFQLKDGWIESGMQRWVSKGAEYGLSGRTKLDGTMEWDLDLSAMLKGHKDGEKIAAALQGAKLGASVRGTVDAPILAMPDVGALVQQGLKSLLETKAQEELQRGINKILGGDKKKIEDEVKRGLEKLLGGKKKKK